ncbi:MAP3K epsilon protein kinase 1 [Diplonema papillatum]|nr:MAP3K epsilon protein kinase 1 [Diplonema papillatum]
MQSSPGSGVWRVAAGWLCLGLAGGAAGYSWEDAVVTIAHPHPDRLEVLEKAAADYSAAHPEVSFNIIRQSWNDLYADIQQNASQEAPSGADLFIVGSTWVPDLYELNVLHPLDDFFEEWAKRRGDKGSIEADFEKSLEETYMFPGQSQVLEWHALPVNIGTRLFFYRKDLYQKHRRLTSAPDTIDEAIELAKNVSHLENAARRAAGGSAEAVWTWGVPSTGDGSNVMQALTTFVMGGGSSFVGKRGACNFEDPGFKKALKQYTDLYLEGGHDFYAADDYDIAARFAQGDLVQMIGASWLYPTLLSGSLSADDIGVSPVPSGSRGPFSFLEGSAWGVPTWLDSRKRRLVWDFLEFLMEPSAPYLADFVFQSDLIPAYESVVRRAKRERADAVAMRQLLLYNASGPPFPPPMPLLGSWMRGTPSSHPELAAEAGGEWIDFEVGALEVELPVATEVFGWSFVANDGMPARDPMAVVFSGFDEATNTWATLQSWSSNAAGVPYARSTALPVQALWNLSTPVAYRRYKFETLTLRDGPCGSTCDTINDQLGYAVPLSYPLKGFSKIGRLEKHALIKRMVKDVYDSDGNETVVDGILADACREYDEIMYDPPLQAQDPSSWSTALTLVVSICAGFVACVVIVGLLYRSFLVRQVTYTHNVNRKLRSDIEVAEDLSRAVAMMDLESVEYLFTLQKPSKIQLSFIGIVRILKEYRAYLPQAVLLDEEKEIETMHRIALDNTSVVKRPEESASSSSHAESSMRALKVRALEVGVRIRKGALLRLALNLEDLAVQWENFAASTAWLEKALSAVDAFEGTSLTLRPNALLASWNAHRFSARAASAATQCALSLQTMLASTPHWWSIALTAGNMAVGHVGTSTQRAPFIVGQPLRQVETMNALAARIKVRILATDNVVEAIGSLVSSRPVDVISSEPESDRHPAVVLWEVHRPAERWRGAPPDMYNDIWVKLRHGEFAVADAAVTELLKGFPRDNQLVRLALVTARILSTGAEARPYTRRLSGWEDSEGVRSSGASPQPDSLAAAFERYTDGAAAAAAAAPAAPEGPGLGVPEGRPPVSANLRTELEQEKSRSRQGAGRAYCPHCDATMELSAAPAAEPPPTWKCCVCFSEGTSRHWTCAECEASKCVDCAQISAPDDEKLPRLMTDQNGMAWHRSEKVLGKGSYGTVWLAMDNAGSLVAMKTVKISERSEKSDELGSLLSEVDVLSAIRHENVVSYFSSCIVACHIVIVMEYVPGGALSNLLEEFGPSLPSSSVKRYLKDILRGLVFLHENGIVHRDLKPGNVLLMIDGQCKLSDFGTSTDWRSPSGRHQARGKTRKVVGTPVYMSPEACRGSCQQSVDIWALGVTVFMMLTGRVPYSIRSFQIKRFLLALGRGEIVPDVSRLEPGHARSFVEDCFQPVAAERADASKLLLHQFLL